MSTIVQLSLAVGGADAPAPLVPLAEANELAGLAERAGVAAIRLRDGETGAAGAHALDPSVVAAHLAGAHGGIGYVAEIPTTHNAPYNTARRVLSLDRAGHGKAGVALLAGAGDEITDAVGGGENDPAQRWAEYAALLARLWDSFPRAALIGDRAAAVVADDALIRPVHHEGAHYRVAGPLDGPSSVQGRPIIVADLGALDPWTAAESADVVVVDQPDVADADAALTDALRAAGRHRRNVALLGRVPLVPQEHSPAELRDWAERHRLDGLELVVPGGTEAVATALRTSVPELTGGPADHPTLRSALGLRYIAAVPS